ncbi:GNAT family N-acetyltransferase [Halopseudomonas xiamenensis]|uniref:GNAT family N-acetyltransferase n=1 Tax=Halopseudomonas xiamenensis TaxID=157792 RepID=UPI001627953B|nr:GNAT family N-acetyltransferase [Halopseudomonas xiamenensis]
MTIRFEWLRSLHDHRLPASDYEALRQSLEHATPFNHLAWLSAAELSLEPNQELWILLAWASDQLQACLPLLYCREQYLGLPFRVVRHLGHPMSDRLTLLIANDSPILLTGILKQIRQQLPHAMLQLDEVTMTAARTSGMTHWSRHSVCWDRRTNCRVPEHLITEADHQEVTGNVRYKLRKARKRCQEVAGTLLRLQPDGQTVDGILAAVRQVEQVSWKGTEGVGIFSGTRQQWMHQALSGLACAGMLRLVAVEVDGRYVSYRLGLLERGRLYDYNLAFLPEYANLGSGRLLLDEWINWGLEEGWKQIDASRVSLNNSSHQLHERMTGQIEHHRWRFYSYRPGGLLLGLSNTFWRRLKPHLQNWKKRLAKKDEA